MKNTIYIDMLDKKIEVFIELFKKIKPEDSGQMRGTYTEGIFRQLLTDFLPENIEVSHGWRIDKNQIISNERDILLYDKTSFPPFLFSMGTGIVPLTSIRYDIEVKSTLSPKSIKDCIGKFDKNCPNNALISLKGNDIFKHYIEIDKNAIKKIPIVKLLCSNDDACYYWQVQEVNAFDEHKQQLMNNLVSSHPNGVDLKSFLSAIYINNINIHPRNQRIICCEWLKFDKNPIKMFHLNVLKDVFNKNQNVIEYLASQEEQDCKVISRSVLGIRGEVLFHEYSPEGNLDKECEIIITSGFNKKGVFDIKASKRKS